MPAPVIYRSSDTNAPVLFGGQGSLVTLLDAILVNGYGSTFATGSLTSDGTNAADGDTVTIGSITYTFRSSLAAQPLNSVLLGGTVAQTLSNLGGPTGAIVNGSASANASTGTLPHPDVLSSWSGNVITLTARKGGSAGNSVVLARASAGTPHFSVSGATLTGGGGSDTKASAGWTKPYGTFPQAVYRQKAGCRFYLQVDDSGPGAGAAREARCFGWEAMTAYNTGLGQFPTPAQVASGVVGRKSSTNDGTVRSWIAFADDRTFYLFTLSGDSTANYHGLSFGDFYSYASETYKCLIMGGATETPASSTNSSFGLHSTIQSGGLVGHYLPRNYTGIGGSTGFVKAGDIALAGGVTSLVGTIGFPNASDGGLYLMPLRIADGSSPGTNLSGSFSLRGMVRGMYQICHPLASFVDGDTFSGSGKYAGRTFQVVKFLHAGSASSSFAVIETTPWDVSA